jgi:hypothetical protein
MLRVPLDLLAAVSLLRSDRWLVHCIESLRRNACDVNGALAVRDAAMGDYSHYNQRQEDTQHALDLHWQPDGHGFYRLDFLRVLAGEWLVGNDGDVFRVPDDRLADYAGLMSMVDPALLAATLMANDLHTGTKAWGEVEPWTERQCSHALPFDADTPYADNHVHMAGVSAAHYGLCNLALLDSVPESVNLKSKWPLVQEFAQMRSERIGTHQLCALLPFLVNEWLREVFGVTNGDIVDRLQLVRLLFASPESQSDDELGIPWQLLSNRCNNLHGYICAHDPVTNVQRLVRRAVELRREHDGGDVSGGWLMLLTALMLDEQSVHASVPGDASRGWLRLAIIHTVHCLRAYAVMRGIGLSEFVQFNNSQVRKLRGAVAKSLIQPSLIRPNRFVSLKASGQFLDKRSLKKLAAELASAGNADRFQFVYHFTRSSEPEPDALRKAGNTFTEQYQQARRRERELGGAAASGAHPGSLLKGLDVAGNENTAPIELFAPTLRKIRKECRKGSTPAAAAPVLYFSIHAGEDFSHLLTGLRRIDETVRFCAMEKGDRLGHALALGIDPFLFAQRQQLAFSPLDEHLDNLVWLHHYLKRIDLPRFAQCTASLEKNIEGYSRYLYGEGLSAADLFEAWRLREYERHDDIDSQPGIAEHASRTQKDIWRAYKDLYGTNRARKLTLRERPPSMTAILRFTPHDPGFGRLVRTGEGKVEETVGALQLDAVEAVQDYLMTLYASDDYDLYLEACPSSNVYIGRFEAFHEHPLYRWLPLDRTKLPNRFGLRTGQVKVCIGTDDPGIFPTTIENEHRVLKDAAMRFHQANEATAQGWIESIRDAGIAQFNRHRG